MEQSKYLDINYTYKKEIDVNNFKESYFKYLSSYFKDLISDYIKKIEVERIDKNTGKIIFYFQLDKKCANPLDIAHGGALISIIENLSTACLFYFDNTYYKTLDINVNYKNQVELNQILILEINCQKIGYKTCFVEAEIKKDISVCTEASIIKSKMKAKF